MESKGKNTTDLLEQALGELEASKGRAAADMVNMAPENERRAALDKKLAALPQHERRRILDAIGLKHVSAAPPPIKTLSGSGYVRHDVRLEPKGDRQPRWTKWRLMPEVEAWQAVALSLDIEPEKLKYRLNAWMGGGENNFIEGNEFNDRLAVLQANLSNKEYFPTTPKFNIGIFPDRQRVRLNEFAAWAMSVAEWDIPDELKSLAKKVEPSAPEQSEHKTANREAETPDESLAALFDPVPVTALENMFKADGKWANWAERASKNGLKNSKISRGLFNPYKAGIWFLHRSIEGWDIARLNRTLINNLPARSRDNAYLLKQDIS